MADWPGALCAMPETRMPTTRTATIVRDIAALSALLTLSACRSVPTHNTPEGVQAQLVLPAFATRHEVKQDERFLMAAELDTPLPAYPEGVAYGHPAVTVCVELIVDAEGRVSGAGMLEDDSNCTHTGSTGVAPFSRTTLATVWTWTFFAAAVCRPPADTEDCDDPRATVEPVASRMAYRFDFNRGRTTMHRATGGSPAKVR